MDARARMATLAWVATTVAVALIASVPGSPFLPLLPPGTSATGPLTPVARAVGLDRLAGDGAAFAGAFALALCAVAFLWLLVECRRGGVGARTVVVLAVVAQLGVLSLPLLLSRDVHSYAMYGRIAAVHGGNPYVDVPSSYPADPFAALVGPRWVDTPAVYGPLFTSVAAIVVRTFDDPRDVVAAFRAIAALAAVATTLVLARLAGTQIGRAHV